ncbi:MAG: phosphoenolpyruvate carboxykinase (ATP), partial [Pseudomonadota bacterium]|nr:phosphoenolpyruvate carboxykinase (ATP) [Pseudomonadota bacterium]
MDQTGFNKSKFGPDIHGFNDLKALHWNHRPAALYQMSLERGEGEIADGGALVVKTGQHTGRSAQDKFIVRDETTENTVWWDNNKSITTEQFDNLYDDMKAYTSGSELFIQDLHGGADV